MVLGPIVSKLIPKGMKVIPMSEVARRLKARKKVIPMSEVAERLKAVRKARATKNTKPNADAAGKAFMKNKPPAGSGDQGKQRVLPRGSKKVGKLQQEFEALSPPEQRKEIRKGARSKFASVLRKLGKLNDGKKGGGKVMYRKNGKKIGSDPKTGATRGTGMEGFTSGKQKPESKKKKRKPLMYLGIDLNPYRKGKLEAKDGGGLTKKDNSALLMQEKKKNKVRKAKGGGKVMKYKKGGIVYKKHGGVVKAASGGDSLIASCYD